MTVYTSYFGNVDVLKRHNIIPMGICAWPPTKFDGINLASVAPPKKLILAHKAHEISDDDFERVYRQEILSMHKEGKNLYNRICELSHGQDVALCCFEKPGEFCHRHILAKWFNENLGIKIEEFSANDMLVKSLSLF